MSKFFYRGTPDIMSDYGKNGYNPKATLKLGSSNRPLSLVVPNQTRELEVQKLVALHKLHANIEVNSSVEENIKELDIVINKPQPQRFDKTPDRNDPCSCGSNKKYKKCCGK